LARSSNLQRYCHRLGDGTDNTAGAIEHVARQRPDGAQNSIHECEVADCESADESTNAGNKVIEYGR
jgi:hypothetical protein